MNNLIEPTQCLQKSKNNQLEFIWLMITNFFGRGRYKMDFGMKTEFEAKLSPRDNEAVYNQNLRMSIHMTEDLIVELALMHNYGIITLLPFCKCTSRNFAQRKPNVKLRLFVDLWTINQLAHCQMHHNTWQGNLCSASLVAARFLFACTWWTNGQWKSLLSILVAEILPTKDL